MPLATPRHRFGLLNLEVNATIVHSNEIRCVVPAHWNSGGQRWNLRVAAQEVEVAVTLNGQDYLRTLPHRAGYTFYGVDDAAYGLSVRQLDPPGGPAAGGTLVRLSGTGFTDLGGDVNGLLCKWAGEPAVEATWEDDEHVLCRSPPRLSGDGTAPFELRTVDVTINGDLNASTSAGVTFNYYNQDTLRLSHVYPRGGSKAGGTAVTVWGSGFLDIGLGSHAEGKAGLYCRFGDASSTLVAATLQESSPGGAGPQALTCLSPPFEERECRTVQVYVTNNGDNPPGGVSLTPTSDYVGFSYFEVHEGLDSGTSTPTGATLREHLPGWTGGDTSR